MSSAATIQARKEAGICPCGKEPAKPGAVQGIICRTKREDRDDARRAAGKCVHCGRKRGKCQSPNHCRRCLNGFRVNAAKGKAVRRYTCSNCGRAGHNCRVCPYPEAGRLP